MHPVDRAKHKFLFRLGIGLIIVNFPFGYGGLAVFSFLAAWQKRPHLFWGGIACYAVSWIMLGIGFALAGHAGTNYARHFWHRCSRRRRLNALRELRMMRNRKKSIQTCAKS